VTGPRAEYERRLGAWRERIAALDRVNFLLSGLRLAIASAGAVLLWMAFVRAAISAMWPLAAWFSFAVVAVAHARRLERFERAKAAELVYARGLDRLDGRWQGRGRDGGVFLDEHPYARDLNLFGSASLFELLNTTRTDIGETTLAEWIRAPAPLRDVQARQAAVAELRPLLDFKEDVAVLAPAVPIGRAGPIARWAASPPVRYSALVRSALAGSALVTIALAYALFRDVVAPEWFIAWLLLVRGALWRRPFDKVLHAIETPERDLALITALLARIESESFAAPALVALRERLLTDGMPASKRIARLRRLVSWLDSTHNLMFMPFAAILLVREQLAVAIDRWHEATGPAVAGWLRTIGDVEALVSFATFAYERPENPFPEIADEGPLYEADGLGHPLIGADGGARNDVALGGAGPRVLIVSGSNMSGKSTLLRSVGVSVALALAGAPVTARRLRLSSLAVGATLHIEDSLQAGHSRFFAEILRIRAIVETARGPMPALFLLDEILHGTNSHDRRVGAEGVVRALVGLGAIGLVTTHDLALTELPSTLGAAAVNTHFEDRLENGTMVFDYRLRPGVVEHSNTLALMREIGLDV